MSQRYFGHRLGPEEPAERRLERRQGRRYYRTVGEPEKVVWLAAPGLD